jgi:stage IV sporulation protein FB
MLRWRLFGMQFCIQPSFWLMSALFGYLVSNFLQPPVHGVEMLKMIGFWVLCTFISVMVHELGHAVTGHIFGCPGNITLGGMGGAAAGQFDKLRSWQRTLVILAGPGAGFTLLFALILVNQRPWNINVAEPLNLEWLRIPWKWDLLDYLEQGNLKSTRPYGEIMKFLCWMNLFWNLINLIPIIPLDGGMLMREACTLFAPIWGLRAAYGFSFLLAAAATTYCILCIDWSAMDGIGMLAVPIRRGWYMPMHPFFMIIMLGPMAIQNFFAMWQVKGGEDDAPAEAQSGRPRRTAYHDPD